MLDIMVRIYGTPSICLGKSRLAKFWTKRPENSRSIRLLHIQYAVTSKRFDRFLKFYVLSLSSIEGNKQKILWW